MSGFKELEKLSDADLRRLYAIYALKGFMVCSAVGSIFSALAYLLYYIKTTPDGLVAQVTIIIGCILGAPIVAALFLGLFVFVGLFWESVNEGEG